MADRIHLFQVTVAAGTQQAAPAVTDLDFPDGIVRAVGVVVPDGVAGLAGCAFTYQNEWIIPYARGTYIVSNDEKILWDVDNKPTGSQWQVTAYNEDVYPHTFYIRVFVDEFPEPLPAPVLPVPIS